MSFTWNAYGLLNLGIDLLAMLLSLGCVAYALRDRTPEAVTALQTLVACARALTLAFCAWIPAAAWIGGILGFCLMARVGWTTATVTLPVLCLALAAGRKAPRVPAIAVSAALLTVKFYGEVWEPANLEVERVTVRVPGLAREVRLVHLSDLQTDSIGPLHDRARAEANAFKPDLVVFTGDVINHPSVAGAAADWLKGFTPEGRKYFVTGDVDGIAEMDGLLGRAGFEKLDGRRLLVKAAGTEFTLLGVDIWSWREAGALARLAEGTKHPRLLLSHRPDAALAAGDAVDLVLSGHTHGGQVCVPFWGPIITLSRVARGVAAGGLHRVGLVQLLVSRGLGWEGHVAPRVRLFCRPHLILVDLRPS